jgi:DNA-directed RNA polymerase subunit beta'
MIKFSDNYDSANTVDEAGNEITRCMVRHSKVFILDEKNPDIIKTEYNVPYGANVFVNEGDVIKAGTTIIQWDPYTDIILARHDGIVNLKDFLEGDTYQIEAVEGGKKQMVIIESKNRQLSPQVEIQNKDGSVMAGGTILPVNATLNVVNKQEVKRGQTLVKIQKDIGKTRDITGGLPRVAELFEARMPSNPAVVTEINGTVKFGETTRGIRKILIESNDGESRSYKIPYGKHVIVHEGDFITAGTPLCEGAISPTDILDILGPGAVREYLVNEIQEVYRLQGVGINDKHIEVIVRQMMKKIRISDPGNSRFLESQMVDRVDLAIENERLSAMAVVADPGDSDWEEGALIEKSDLREINKELKENDKNPIKTHKTKPATFDPLLMGITQASLNTESYLSAASFQETTRVLTDAATAGKTDHLRGLKENVVIGRLIPAGTGFPELQDVALESKEPIKTKESEEIPVGEIV